MGTAVHYVLGLALVVSVVHSTLGGRPAALPSVRVRRAGWTSTTLSFPVGRRVCRAVSALEPCVPVPASRLPIPFFWVAQVR